MHCVGLQSKRTLDCITIQRSDTDGGCDYEVTVTSEPCTSRNSKQTEKESQKAASSGGLDTGRDPKDGAQCRDPLMSVA